MYNFEMLPQIFAYDFPGLEGIFKMRQGFMKDLFAGDGLVTCGTPEMEPESTNEMPKLIDKPVYAVGYSPHEVSGAEEIPPVMNHPRFPTDDGRVKLFMDDCLAKNGSRSMVYIRSVILH